MHILIADDHHLVLDALQMKLGGLAAQVSFTRINSADRLAAVDGSTLDLAIVDLLMPGANAGCHILDLQQRHPELPLVVLSACEESEVVHRLLDAGVRGFISKSDSSEIMLAALQLVLQGGVYVPPLLLRPKSEASQVQLHGNGALTARQLEVLDLLGTGSSNKLIARQLGISEGTVKIHLAAIFRVLGARNRAEAVAKAALAPR